MTRARVAVAGCLVAALAATAGPAPRPARADGDAGLPPGLAALPATPEETARAARAMAALGDPSPEVAAAAAHALLLSGAAGLREAARALLRGDAPEAARGALVEVVGASDAPEADAVLAAAADARRFEVRAAVARALGAGRSDAAVPTLARLALDPSGAVRAAALRALFALETAAAVEARVALPADRDADLLALRFRLHRLRGDDAPRLLALATSAAAFARAPAVRVEAVRWLATHDGPEADDLLEAFVAETWGTPAEGREVRAGLGVACEGYVRATERCAGTEALLALLGRPTTPVATRALLVELAVDALARPQRTGGAEIDEEARVTLEARLPEVGAALVGPTLRALREGRFDDPKHGTRLLASLERGLAVASLGDLVLADPPETVLKAAAGELALLRRVGRAEVADALRAAGRPSDVRAAAVTALADEPEEIAAPRLVAALDDPDVDAASRAADVLLERRARGEASAWAALSRALLTEPTRAFERTLLDTLAAAPDDAAYALFEQLMTQGPVARRRDVLDAIRSRTSRMRGHRAAALVRRAAEDLSLGLKPGDVAPALTSVDGAEGVRYIRARWRDASAPGVFLRNLRQVRHVSALDFALELAASLPDSATALLNELMTVLSEAPATDPARTDPFWRRMLAHPDPELRAQAVRTLPRVEHGDLVALLLPVVTDPKQPASLRLDALRGCADASDPPSTETLWALASDRLEDEDLCQEAARRLVLRADADLRRRALAWLGRGVDEASEVVDTMAVLAGRGASSAEAAALLAGFERDVDVRFGRTPYFRPSDAVDDDSQRAAVGRASSQLRSLAAAADPVALAALAARVFDPRFARYALEARRYAAFGRGLGGGPLAGAWDPPEAGLLLYTEELDPNAVPVSVVPDTGTDIVAALVGLGPPDAPRLLVRALDDARASGALAAFPDAYLVTLLRRVDDAAATAPRDPARDAAVQAVLDALNAALVRAWPVAGAQELWAAEQRVARASRSRDFAAAAVAAADAVRLAARTGLCDLSPSRWLAEGRTVPRDWFPWRTLRARQDLLEAAAAAAAGRAEAATEGFRRGLARARDRAGVLRLAAHLKHAVGFDLPGAADDLRRAVELARRTGGEATEEDGALLAALESGAPAPPRDGALPAGR
ncbi:MAG: hypothetical protein U1E39_15680 [Planctomycetota bacterium]